MPIIPKLAITYIISIVICIFIVSSFYFYTVKKEIEVRSRELASNTIKQTQVAIKSRINLYNNLIDALYLNGNFQDLLFFEYYDYIESLKTAEKLLVYLDPISETISSASDINLYVSNHTIPQYKDTIFKIENILEESWYKELNHALDKIVWKVTKNDAALQDESIAFRGNTISLMRNIRALRVSQSPANYLGVIKIDFDTEKFFEEIIDSSVNERSWINILDRNNTLIFNNSAKAKESQLVSSIDKIKAKSGSESIELGGKKYMVVYDTLEPIGWKFFYFISFNDYSENIGKLRFVSALLVISVIIVFMGISWFMAAEFTKNIRKLSGFMKEVEKGNLNIYIPEKGKDEIGNLISGFNKMTSRLKKLIDEVYKNKLAEKEYELQALQAQINPHFLYNALSSISWLGLRHNVSEVSDMSNSLVRFYKNTLCGGKSIITLEQELEQIKSYIELQGMRYKNKLKVTYEYEEEVLKSTTMKFILQPFVENCLEHGLYEEKNRINVRIVVEKDGDDILWRIIDDGVGICNSTIDRLTTQRKEKSSGYGIYNVDKRIKTYYGEEYGVSIFSRMGIGTVITVKIPYSD